MLIPSCPTPHIRPAPRSINQGDGNSSQAGQTLTGAGFDPYDAVQLPAYTQDYDCQGRPEDFELLAIPPEVLIWSTKC